MQYSKNMGIMTTEELKVIQDTNVIVIGVGGLGGYIASSLVRLGVSNITIVDLSKSLFDNIVKICSIK